MISYKLLHIFLRMKAMRLNAINFQLISLIKLKHHCQTRKYAM